MSIRFDGRVAIVTGAAAGLGRSHARALAARGAKVVVNDFGGDVHGTGGSSGPAERVAEEIRQAGGEAISHGASVTNADQVAHMVDDHPGEMGPHRHPGQQRGHPARRQFPEVEPAGLPHGHRRAPARFRDLQPGRVAAHEGRELRSHPDDDVHLGPLRQFRPGELRRGQDRPDRPDERAADRRRQERHPRERAVSFGGHAHDRGAACPNRCWHC